MTCLDFGKGPLVKCSDQDSPIEGPLEVIKTDNALLIMGYFPSRRDDPDVTSLVRSKIPRRLFILQVLPCVGHHTVEYSWVFAVSRSSLSSGK